MNNMLGLGYLLGKETLKKNCTAQHTTIEKISIQKKMLDVSMNFLFPKPFRILLSQ